MIKVKLKINFLLPLLSNWQACHYFACNRAADLRERETESKDVIFAFGGLRAQALDNDFQAWELGWPQTTIFELGAASGAKSELQWPVGVFAAFEAGIFAAFEAGIFAAFEAQH